MIKKITFLLLIGLLSMTSVEAQDRAPSPSATLKQKVGLTDITVEYSRPGMKDRKIFAADGLVPFGQMWRTGANAATKITISDAVKVEGKDLAAGSYAITSVPGASSWTINFYPYEESRWTSYRDKTPTVSATVTPQTMDVTVESFLIDLGNLRDYSAVLGLIWENTFVPVALTVK